MAITAIVAITAIAANADSAAIESISVHKWLSGRLCHEEASFAQINHGPESVRCPDPRCV